MSNRHITVLASIALLYLAGSLSQASVVNDQSRSSVTSRQPDSPAQEDQSAAADDDSDSSDDFQLLACTWDCLPSLAATSSPLSSESIIGPSSLATTPTLESQHILLRF